MLAVFFFLLFLLIWGYLSLTSQYQSFHNFQVYKFYCVGVNSIALPGSSFEYKFLIFFTSHVVLSKIKYEIIIPLLTHTRRFKPLILYVLNDLSQNLYA